MDHDPAAAAVLKYGTGVTGSRFLNGTLDLHEKLEADLAEFTGFEAALVMSTGYQTNLGIIQSLVGRDDTLGLPQVRSAVFATQAVAHADWREAVLLMVFAYGGANFLASGALGALSDAYGRRPVRLTMLDMHPVIAPAT